MKEIIRLISLLIKQRTLFELVVINDASEYRSDSLRSHVNTRKAVNYTAETEISLYKEKKTLKNTVEGEQEYNFFYEKSSILDRPSSTEQKKELPRSKLIKELGESEP